jgi:hypothetical protein
MGWHCEDEALYHRMYVTNTVDSPNTMRKVSLVCDLERWTSLRAPTSEMAQHYEPALGFLLVHGIISDDHNRRRAAGTDRCLSLGAAYGRCSSR